MTENFVSLHKWWFKLISLLQLVTTYQYKRRNIFSVVAYLEFASALENHNLFSEETMYFLYTGITIKST